MSTDKDTLISRGMSCYPEEIIQFSLEDEAKIFYRGTSLHIYLCTKTNSNQSLTCGVAGLKATLSTVSEWFCNLWR